MSTWMWLFGILMIALGAVALWLSWRKRYFRFGPIIYTLSDDPIHFWIFVMLVSLAELWFIGLLILAVIAAIWGPIFHQT